MLIILLTVSCYSNGQIGMTNKDSVLVPVKWLREGMKDLIRLDALKEQLPLLQSALENQKEINLKLDTFNTVLKDQNTKLLFRYNETVKQMDLIEINNKKAITSLNKQLKKTKQKNVVTSTLGIAGGIGIGIILGLFFIR